MMKQSEDSLVSKVPRRRYGRWASIAFLLATQHLASASPIHADTGFDLHFEPRAVSLPAEARNRLTEAVDLARTWCGFMFAYATGHADPSEGKSSRALVELSESRSAYVRQLLRQRGVPASRVHGEGKGASQRLFFYSSRLGLAGRTDDIPRWSGRVAVYMVADAPAKTRFRDSNAGCPDRWSEP